MDKAQRIFEDIRDRPYSVIAKENEKPQQCFHKNSELIVALSRLGYGVRGRLGEIDWSDLKLPPSIISLYPKDIMPTHFYCELFQDSEWHILDASWDPPMKKIGSVSEWNQKNTSGFIIRHLYSIQEQTEFFDYWSNPVRCEDYEKRSADFLKAFDDWIIEQRLKASKS